jgi:hypothetical protein
VNTKQQTILEDINHNVVAIGRFLIESLTPKRKKDVITPRIKRKKTLAETAIIVLSKASRPIRYMEVRQRVRGFPHPHGDKYLGPALRGLLKKGVIKMQKSSGKHMYSIAKRAA